MHENVFRTADLLTDSGNFLSWQMSRQKYNLASKNIMHLLDRDEPGIRSAQQIEC